MAKTEAKKKPTRASTRRVANARTPARAAVKTAKAKTAKTKKLTRAQQKAHHQSVVESLGEAAGEKAHDIPIDVMFLEVMSLIENVEKPREILAVLPNVGIEPVDTLAFALADLRAHQRAYEQARTRASTKAAARVIKEAEKLDRQLVEVGRLIYAHDPETLGLIDQIVQGSGVADQAADLRALGELLQPHEAVVNAIPTLPANPLVRAAELVAHLEGSVNRAALGEAWAARNVSFWALDALAEQVRAGLRVIYANQPKMLKKVLSRYGAERTAKSRARNATLKKKLAGG